MKNLLKTAVLVVFGIPFFVMVVLIAGVISLAEMLRTDEVK